MAVDETLFLTADVPGFQVLPMDSSLRFLWLFHPLEGGGFAVPGRDLVRRWTGGGIVEHGRGFYLFAGLPGGESLPATIEFYRFVHLAIANILRKSGCPVEMALILTEPIRSPACFEKAVQFDLKLRGEKIAGAAIRRNRKGLLLQGSIQRLKVPDSFGVMLAGALW